MSGPDVSAQTRAGSQLNVLQVCDHLGWEGSRMHGVKRLFAWMIPRFDRSRFNVSLVSLRKKDLSEETLDALGIDIEYLHRSKFDPATLTALLKIIDRKEIDILHLHGYGATTFGRLAGAMRRLPDDPARAREPHRHAVVPESGGSAAGALYRHRARRVEEHRRLRARRALVPATKVKVVYLGAPVEEFSRPRDAGGNRRRAHALGIETGEFAAGTVTRLHDSKGNEYLVEAARLVVDGIRRRASSSRARDRCAPALEAQAAAPRPRRSLRVRRLREGRRGDASAFDLSVFPSLWEGTPLTAFEALASAEPIVATDADGLTDILDAGQTAWIVPKRDAAALAERIVYAIEHPDERARLAASAGSRRSDFDITAFVRKMERLYTLLHDVSRPTKRRGILPQDLSFLTEACAA